MKKTKKRYAEVITELGHIKPIFHIPRYYQQVSSVDRRLTRDIDLKGKHVLDIGAGKYLSAGIYFLLEGADYTAIDNEEPAIKIAREKSEIAYKKRLIPKRAKLIHGDGRHLPFPEDHFDIVTCYSTVEHLSNPKDRLRLIKEMVRVAKKGGHIIITVPNKLNPIATTFSWVNQRLGGRTEHRYTPNELKEIMTSFGLKIKKFDSEYCHIIDKELLDKKKLPLKPINRIMVLILSPLSFFLRKVNRLKSFSRFGMRMGFRAIKTI